MKLHPLPCLSLAAFLVLAACASVPAKRVDTVVRAATVADLRSPLGEVFVEIGPADGGIERVVREVFPVAAAKLGIPVDDGESGAEYAIWLRAEEYEVGIDTYTTVLCVLKLRSKSDGTVLATTIVTDESRLELKSSGYIYSLVREALASLAHSIAVSKKDASK
jgi:hypothetical protein